MSAWEPGKRRPRRATSTGPPDPDALTPTEEGSLTHGGEGPFFVLPSGIHAVAYYGLTREGRGHGPHADQSGYGAHRGADHARDHHRGRRCLPRTRRGKWRESTAAAAHHATCGSGRHLLVQQHHGSRPDGGHA